MSAENNEGRVGGYVLAGGGSTRFGRDKALVEFAGKPMLERMVELMRSFEQDVKIVAAPGKYSGFDAQHCRRSLAGRRTSRRNHYCADSRARK